MPYPWPSFGSFTWLFDEKALDGIGGQWKRKPSIERIRPLGSGTDSILVMAVGSSERQFECYLSPDRFLTLEALANTVATFTDWDRPPDSRSAYLESVEGGAFVPVICSDGITRRRIRTTVSFLSQ